MFPDTLHVLAPGPAQLEREKHSTMIVFPCTQCGAHQRAGDHLVGRRLRCQSCNNPMIIPGASAPLPPIVPRPAAPPAPTAANMLAQPVAAAAPAPAPAATADDDIFFEHIRKGGRRQSKYL